MSTDMDVWRRSLEADEARPVAVGPKLMDGLRAIEAYRRDGMPFADARLEAMGYPPNMAYSILRRLCDKGLVESGVSERTGWLTDKGRATHALAPFHHANPTPGRAAR